jgi:nucleotide-binding universal stress UspA family protein
MRRRVRGSRRGARAIVHATDFSPASRRALRVAIAWARRDAARLVLLHVLTPPSPFLAADEALPRPTWEALEAAVRKDAQQRLRRLAAAARRAGARVETALRRGIPADEVARFARRHRVAVIAIGTHGRAGLARAFMGSVAGQIVRLAACPVLTVKGPTGARR